MGFHYNHTTLVGRLTKDPEIKKMSSNTRTCFRLAVSRPNRNEDGSTSADFIPIVIWGRLAELAFRFLKKGGAVLIDGRIHVRQYDTEGQARWMTEIIADNFQVLNSGSSHDDLIEGAKGFSESDLIPTEDISTNLIEEK